MSAASAKPIRTVGIVSKPRSEHAAQVVPALVDWLQKKGILALLDPESANYHPDQAGEPTREDVAAHSDLIVVLGGDGTLLSAARAVQGRDVPLFAVNLGNLGFLTAITVDEIYPELERALTGDYTVSRRRMLRTELWRDGKCVLSLDALNDVTLAKAQLARIIDLQVFVNDHLMAIYKADGLIISTPTGSTAYSLSAGGPIVYPTVAAFCVTPICPHTLTHRPVIVPDDTEIKITTIGESSTYLTVDGQVGELMHPGDEVICRRSDHVVNLIRQADRLFFDVLREKLKWGDR
jgi:NAD+ kinase